MITLTPKPFTKWKNIKTGHIFPGDLTLGIFDSPANYELVDITEYEEQVKAEEKARKAAKMKYLLEQEEKRGK